MTELPPNVYRGELPDAGSGLFASQLIEPGEEVFRVQGCLVSVLNQSQLTTACANCFLWVPENSEDGVGAGALGEEPKSKKLRACQRCKIVRYCSKECQAQSWSHSHKYECKLFSKLYPQVLPNTARIVTQLLLRRKAKDLPSSDWQAFLALQSHIDDFRSSHNGTSEGLSTWQTIELMSQAASKYSDSREPMQFIQEMTARVLVNALTLTTPTFDPLGLTLSTTASLLNHSCTPNTAITYSGRHLTLRSLISIPQATEITISYTAPTTTPPTRLTHLQARYFFTCTCPSCSTHTTNNLPEISDTAIEALSVRAIELQNTASSQQKPEQAGPLLKQALDLFKPYPPHLQPYPAILHTAFLNAISLQNWPAALAYSLRAYFFIDAIHYQPEWHPVRIVRKWVLLRLVVQTAALMSEGDASVKGLEKYGVDWRVFALALLRDIEEGGGRSHGVDSIFAKQVDGFARDAGMGRGSVEGEVVGREMRKLRRIAEDCG
ncbi:hypothetical protein N7G274_010426 [Stereocaulon virgatum]|uniref:MYND-type zinc finger protein samB n=1 Tax=Stereocaulon virgatum TaxID=373712 RepID=A0ABR3ZUF6_9LECA